MIARSRRPRQSLAAALVGSFSEAWAEVRIHRTRVLLSLIGVAVAVAAISSVVGLGAIVQQSVQESNERYGGRPAMLQIYANDDSGTVDAATVSAAFDSVVDRYRIRYHSEMLNGSVSVQFPQGSQLVQTTAVDVDYGEMHRIALDRGTWFTAADERRMAPAAIVSPAFWKLLGSPDLRTHPTVAVADGSSTAVITAVSNGTYSGDMPTMFVLASAFPAIADAESSQGMVPQYEAWVPPAISPQLQRLVKRDLKAALGSSLHVEVNRSDYAAQSGDPLLPIRLGVGGVAGLVLFLGALGLVNISLVTVRQRIREIGIRRSFGATAGRVFLR